MYYDQHEYNIRCEWGFTGVTQLASSSHSIIIVDVLSFSTAVDIAVENGAVIYPYRWNDETATAYAEAHCAMLAGSSGEGGYSLSLESLLGIPAGTRLVLPSPNGSTLSLATGDVPTFAGCLRNARAVAHASLQVGQNVAIIPAGERWKDGTLRVAWEDLIGAGAIIHHLQGTKSPEAVLAESAFTRFRGDLLSWLGECSSGRELIGRGLAYNVELASALDTSNCVPTLRDRAYIQNGA